MRFHLIPKDRDENGMQKQRDRQRRPQKAVVARGFAPTQLMQHGARGSIEGSQTAVFFVHRGKPAVVLDLVGAFDKAVLATLPG